MTDLTRMIYFTNAELWRMLDVGDAALNIEVGDEIDRRRGQGTWDPTSTSNR